MLTKTLSVVLLTCALFSGQLLAKQQDHAFVWFATGGHQLRHEADSDELRAAAEESRGRLARAPQLAEIAQTRELFSLIKRPYASAAFSSALQGSLKRQRCRAGAFLRCGF